MEELDLSFINTGTVAIFSPKMEEIICVVNKKCGLIVPPGGKYDPKKDNGEIINTVTREANEEIGISLTSRTGVWLDEKSEVTKKPVLILREDFVYPDGKIGRDFLFFFRLLQQYGNHLAPGQTPGFWFTRQHITENLIFPIYGGEYGLIPSSIRSKIVPIMKYADPVKQKPRKPITELFRSKTMFPHGKK